MNDKDLLDALENSAEVTVPYFDGQSIKMSDCDLPATEALPALKNFLKLSAEQRRSDARHLLAYCKMMVNAVGEEILDSMGWVEPSLEQIWNYVTIRHLFFGKLEAGKYAAQKTIYVQLEGDVPWEEEHGLQMSWANGSQLVKVSSFDGHPTNGHAEAKTERDKYVFSCYYPELCTLPEPS